MSIAVTTIDNKVRRVVSNIRNLPTPPIVFHQIHKVIHDPKVSAGHISAILAEDPAMSVKVLKLTNSAFYGLAREVDSVKQAVVIVGLEAIKNLVLSASVLDMFKGKDIEREYQEGFWRHSLATASCCRLLVRRLRTRGFVDPDAAFSAGLLHDIGKLVITSFLPEERSLLQQARRSQPKALDYVLEETTLGYTHAQIGGFLAVQWKLPQRLADAITYHHYPQLNDSEDALVYFVHVADFVAKRTFYDEDETYLIGALQPGVCEYLCVTEDELSGLAEDLRAEYLHAKTFMELAGIS
ncbi:MAG TPA: HDOD domain-containing protein [Candidatus Deferrimicrobium sp.]|nr:HDOD domain-containing protein [Candidatus Deferrimicrobium sp.]